MKKGLSQQNPNSNDLIKSIIRRVSSNIMVAMPAMVKDVNYSEQTLTAQPVISTLIKQSDLEIKDVQLPLALDVPFQVYQGGGYHITVPIAPADEVLLIFADYDFSAWWQNGSYQKAEHLMRHSYSNALAIVGFNSQPRAIANYNTNGIEVRSNDGTQLISMTPDGITLTSGSITLNGNTTINGNASISGTLNTSGAATLQDKDFISHTHTSGAQGAPTSGVN